MKLYTRISQLFYYKAFLLSVILGPVFIFLHEIVHAVFFELGGIKAHFLRFSMAAPINFTYDFYDLKKAVSFYNSSNHVVFAAAISAPLFTLIFSYISLLLYRLNKKIIFWVLSINPLIFRLVGATIKIPAFVDGYATTSDEAVAARFINVPLTTFLWPSLVLGYLCIILLFLCTEKNNRLKYMTSTILGGTLGYFIIEQLVNMFII
ncbi:hypothetical protein [Anaerocolumna sp. MB42-C2]|uniref:hypothetical protein n=1 Tax=Anaerocolumna sp. MB42-C2 TaxID=3070997 RepID=UPI0027DFEFE8|nr:hypothetical protein [Anaerocolumna sp. MB42-C2]WMJ86869.1 hypothetical protein RBU59_22985 [Anaerocolumna sp. MB42-C2]